MLRPILNVAMLFGITLILLGLTGRADPTLI